MILCIHLEQPKFLYAMLSYLKYVLIWFVHYSCFLSVIKVLDLTIFYSWNLYLHNLICLLISCIGTYYTFELTERAFLNGKISCEGLAVLITGCDSGFGHALAKRLHSRGYHVFACCLIPSGPGATQLANSCSKKLQVIEMNVTEEESVKEAFENVKNNLGDLKLWAIVNNAGIQKGFSTDFATLRDFKDTMEVNGFGVVRVTKAFLPLLKESKGRVVNLTSLHGRVAAPYNTPYVMSKFAATGFSECLRYEMNTLGIEVIQVEPELYRTNITNAEEVRKRLNSEINSLDPNLREEYGQTFIADLKIGIERILTGYSSTSILPVIDALESAVTAKYPAIVYNPSRNYAVKIFIFILEMLPYRMKDLIMIFFHYLHFSKPKKV